MSNSNKYNYYIYIQILEFPTIYIHVIIVYTECNNLYSGIVFSGGQCPKVCKDTECSELGKTAGTAWQETVPGGRRRTWLEEKHC